ncbi:unnamed protein product [Adineta steineri]|uniref:PCNA-interacting partner n=1 Tax=Adineta steineri TaxID=433720 RepID=A0A815IKG0_9BILA|nr:unnamed protein product [Adineta steineri]
MQIKLTINNNEDDDLVVISLDSSSTISSWLIDYYFTKIYSNQIKTSNKSIQPNNIIGLHDMFIIYQIIHSSTSSIEFLELCKKKFQNNKDDLILENYNKYLNRCGLKDIIDLFHQCQIQTCIKMIDLNINHINNEIDRLFFDHLLEIALERSIYNEETQITTIETSENIVKLFEKEKKHMEQTISKNYIKHTLCTYLSLLLDTRNEHALIHCLATPVRTGIERRTIVELRRLTKLSKNECLTIYQILLSFIRRKELLSSRLSQSSSSQSSQESTNNDDESFIALDKYYVGIKEFFDFIEQLQMIIEENEHLKIDSIVTFRKLMMLISKQLRKDISFNRCESIFKDIIEEFCECFQTTHKITDCISPIRSASSGGTLAGRRFLRSIAYLCAKQTIHLPIILTTNDHYDSPSTGLRKATSSRLLRSPLTPIPIVIEKIVEIPIEEKSIDIPAESVFMWKKKTKENDIKKDIVPTKKNKFERRKSQRCLDLSAIEEKSFDSGSQTSHSIDSNENISSGSIRQPLGEIHMNSFEIEQRQQIDNDKNSNPIPFSLISEGDKENLSLMNNKRTTTTSTNAEEPRKKQKKTNTNVLVVGQKMITTFFRSKS